jgi:hypothetical protein
MKHFILLLIVLPVMFISCQKDNDVIEKKKPGYFVVTELKGSLKSSNDASIQKTAQSGFDLGDLKASRNFSFILTNGGNQPIFDIILTTDNESFTVSPGEIPSLAGNTQFDSISGSGFIPIISLGIIHGLQLNGVGFADLLPMGINSSVLTITGKTLDGNDTISISASYDFTVNAKVMDVKFYVNGSEIDLTKNYSVIYGATGFVRYYKIESHDFEIENIGNVDIDLTYGSAHTLLEQNAKKQVFIAGLKYFRLDGHGAITDNSRIQLGNDGIGYFVVDY